MGCGDSRVRVLRTLILKTILEGIKQYDYENESNIL